jgi:hypothetical protein
MALKSFVEGGYDVNEGKILVVVKSIGARKKGLGDLSADAELR